jgi:hypothetical protein
MGNTASDIQFLKDRYTRARNKFKPPQIKTLLVAEAPPCSLDRYFYFEDVPTQDSLFLEVMGVLYPDQKVRYLVSGRDPDLKRELLESFKEDGYWLMDLSEIPTSLLNDPIGGCVPSLLKRMEKDIESNTQIVLIKANVYDTCYEPLISNGYKVHNERIPFPGSGQQRVFREKFLKVIRSFDV